MGYIEKRRSAISDAMVILSDLTYAGGLDWHDEETFRVPASLIVLIRYQLCAGTPELHQTFLSRKRRRLPPSSPLNGSNQARKYL